MVKHAVYRLLYPVKSLRLIIVLGVSILILDYCHNSTMATVL